MPGLSCLEKAPRKELNSPNAQHYAREAPQTQERRTCEKASGGERRRGCAVLTGWIVKHVGKLYRHPQHLGRMTPSSMNPVESGELRRYAGVFSSPRVLMSTNSAKVLHVDV